MNSQEQQRRHTAVSRLEADMETVIDGVVTSTGQQLDALRADFDRKITALQASLEYAQNGVRELDQQQRAYVDVADRELRVVVISTTEPLRRGFWGRWKHLLTGR